MNKLNNPMPQPNPIALVHALLDTVQTPLRTLTDLWQTPAELVAELTPPLDVVAFSPFAQLSGNEAGPRHSARSAVRQTAAATAVTPAPPMMPSTMPSTMSSTGSTPVFALPAHKRTPTTAGAAADQASGLPPLSREQATPPHTVGDQPDVATVAPLTAMPLLDQLTHTLLSSPAVTGVEAAAGASGVTPSALATAPLGWGMMATALPSPATRVFALEEGLPRETTARETTGHGALLATIALLADLTQDLLTPPLATPVAPAATQPAEKARPPAVTMSMLPPLLSSPKATPALDPTPLVGFTPVREGAAFRSIAENAWPASASPSIETLNQPDAWTLAQLINDVLAEEARRHGVDLS